LALIFDTYIVKIEECFALGFNGELGTGPMDLPITFKGANRDHGHWIKGRHPDVAIKKQGLIGKWFI